jgi:hypothetical protein
VRYNEVRPGEVRCQDVKKSKDKTSVDDKLSRKMSTEKMN